ncbi:hypothetical protein SLS60_005102 [Paraconiothyrium brasiliense]|uniref:F-box domain-containing protein n=1 Tax=Paraconiothyrium brasiliense TaxID=300254 RepID=A0ABR3RGE2_9PLEO
MTKTFSDLSVDLVYVIFSHLWLEKIDLCNLALTCRPFRDIAQRFLVRDTSISHSVNGSRTKLFLRTLMERPDLVVHVHRLELDLLREDIHWPEEQQTIHQITRLLTNLRDFCYLSRDYKAWHYSVPLPLKWTREHAHDQVRRVEWHHNMAPWELRKCMELPSIEKIRVRELQDDSYGRFTSFDLPARKHRTSSLTELRIGSPSTLASEALHKLLHMPRNLKKITFESRKEYHSVLQPAGLVFLLQPVRNSLEELHVEIRENLFGTSTQTVNLSEFTSVRNLTLPFRYIFGPGTAASPLSAAASLPPHLRDLKVRDLPASIG